MDKDIVGSDIVGINKLREALAGDKLVFLVGRGARHFAMEYFGVDTSEVEAWLGHQHPARVAKCLESLQREATSGQARGGLGLVTSTNPAVLNEAQPKQVFLLTHWGRNITPIMATRNFVGRSRSRELGELWLHHLSKTEDDSEPRLISAVRS